MPELAPRYPCPVCLGVQLEKVSVGEKGALVLDYCRRCGGIWFEYGEVQQLRRGQPPALWDRIDRRSEDFRMQCHSCHVPMERNAAACPACGWRNRLDCPECQSPLQPHTHGGVRLDACEKCRGVWFDHAELASIWDLSLRTSFERRRPGTKLAAAGDGSLVLPDALMYSPEVVFYGAAAAGHVVSASVEVLANAPEMAVGAVGVAGEAAASVFEVVLDIVGGLFS